MTRPTGLQTTEHGRLNQIVHAVKHMRVCVRCPQQDAIFEVDIGGHALQTSAAEARSRALRCCKICVTADMASHSACVTMRSLQMAGDGKTPLMNVTRGAAAERR